MKEKKSPGYGPFYVPATLCPGNFRRNHWVNILIDKEPFWMLSWWKVWIYTRFCRYRPWKPHISYESHSPCRGLLNCLCLYGKVNTFRKNSVRFFNITYPQQKYDFRSKSASRKTIPYYVASIFRNYLRPPFLCRRNIPVAWYSFQISWNLPYNWLNSY